MRALAVGLGVVALLCAGRGLALLSQPVPPTTDLEGFAFVAGGALLALLALVLLRRRAWHVWAASAWLGCSIAAVVLAYKDTLVEEIHVLGGWTVLGHALAQAFIAPITIGFGFLLGFRDPHAWMYVLACVAVALLGGELLRRRLWPRVAAPPLSVGSSAGP